MIIDEKKNWFNKTSINEYINSLDIRKLFKIIVTFSLKYEFHKEFNSSV